MSACESHERPESIKSKCTKQIWPGSVWNWELQVGVLRIHTSRNSCGVFTFLTSELIGAHPVTAHRKGAHRIAAQSCLGTAHIRCAPACHDRNRVAAGQRVTDHV